MHKLYIGEPKSTTEEQTCIAIFFAGYKTKKELVVVLVVVML